MSGNYLKEHLPMHSPYKLWIDKITAQRQSQPSSQAGFDPKKGLQSIGPELEPLVSTALVFMHF